MMPCCRGRGGSGDGIKDVPVGQVGPVSLGHLLPRPVGSPQYPAGGLVGVSDDGGKVGIPDLAHYFIRC